MLNFYKVTQPGSQGFKEITFVVSNKVLTTQEIFYRSVEPGVRISSNDTIITLTDDEVLDLLAKNWEKLKILD